MVNKRMIMDKVNGLLNKEVKQDVYKLRHRHDAVLTGRRTVELDDPQYTTRIQDGKNPIKVTLSKSGIFILISKFIKMNQHQFGYILKIQI